MLNRTLIIHKATNNSIKDEDASINITQLHTPNTFVAVETFQNEGKGIAQIFFNMLPGATLTAMIAELERLQNV